MSPMWKSTTTFRTFRILCVFRGQKIGLGRLQASSYIRVLLWVKNPDWPGGKRRPDRNLFRVIRVFRGRNELGSAGRV
jgi:hypothetical protein